jgi:hypothetical protein
MNIYLWQILNFKHQARGFIVLTQISPSFLPISCLWKPLLDVNSLLIILPSCNLGPRLLEEVSSPSLHVQSPIWCLHPAYEEASSTPFCRRRHRYSHPVRCCIVIKACFWLDSSLKSQQKQHGVLHDDDLEPTAVLIILSCIHPVLALMLPSLFWFLCHLIACSFFFFETT